MIFLISTLSCFLLSSARLLEPVVRDFSPRLALRGDAITLAGARFADSPQLQCRLESAAAEQQQQQQQDAAVYISPTRVQCRVPLDVALTTFRVSVTNDGVRFVRAPANLTVVAHKLATGSSDVDASSDDSQF
jgi:hypothetical protein